jgi:hypothetical protein
MFVQFLPDLHAECRDRQVIQLLRQGEVFIMGGTADFFLLSMDISRLFGGDI